MHACAKSGMITVRCQRMRRHDYSWQEAVAIHLIHSRISLSKSLNMGTGFQMMWTACAAARHDHGPKNGCGRGRKSSACRTTTARFDWHGASNIHGKAAAQKVRVKKLKRSRREHGGARASLQGSSIVSQRELAVLPLPAKHRDILCGVRCLVCVTIDSLAPPISR